MYTKLSELSYKGTFQFPIPIKSSFQLEKIRQ